MRRVYVHIIVTCTCFNSRMLLFTNAQIGSERKGFEQTIGPHGTAAAHNDNGERFISFCSTNGFSIGNTYFQHKLIHKKTWRSPDGKTLNEIDYICVNNRWKSSLRDVRVKRGADIGSDHYLLVTTVKLRLKRKKREKTDKDRKG